MITPKHGTGQLLPHGGAPHLHPNFQVDVAGRLHVWGDPTQRRGSPWQNGQFRLSGGGRILCVFGVQRSPVWRLVVEVDFWSHPKWATLTFLTPAPLKVFLSSKNEFVSLLTLSRHILQCKEGHCLLHQREIFYKTI